MVIVGLFGETSSRVVFDNCDTRIVSRMVFKNGDIDMEYSSFLLEKPSSSVSFFFFFSIRVNELTIFHVWSISLLSNSTASRNFNFSSIYMSGVEDD